MTRHTPLNRDEYRAVAVKLAAIHDELVRLKVLVSNSMSQTKGRRWSRAMDVQQSKLLTARLRLEDLACGALGEDEGMAVCRVGQPRPALQYETQTPDVAVPESKE